ncbi:MAG: TetR/AcrR family transcriptional regulator [Burkholderiales bacterium]|nr:TetR/AcrR family transcriptional regulator [Burkholderiales bacterium]
MPASSSRERLLDATIELIRTKGYAGMRVEDVCEATGLTKGSFFHHFASKEEIAMAAAERFASRADAMFSRAGYRDHGDALQRLLGYVDFRQGAMQGELAAFTCLLGMLAQETFSTHPQLSAAAGRHIEAHAATLEDDIAAAKADHAPEAPWTPHSLALFTQAVIQGAFVLAKSRHNPAIAADCLDHLRRYLELTFRAPQPPPARSRRRAPTKP